MMVFKRKENPRDCGVRRQTSRTSYYKIYVDVGRKISNYLNI